MYRDLKYWQEKAALMVEDYTPELSELLSKKELKEVTDRIGRMAERDYRDRLATKQADAMEESIAREFTEEMMEEQLYSKRKELLGETDEDDEENYSEEEMDLFLDWVNTLNN